MSFHTADEAECSQASGAVELVIRPKEKDLGEFKVKRVLPALQRRMVGPFIFFDHMGPAEFPPGVGIQVRPHPHIGIATITYLFEGEIIHRDSLGVIQPIQAGAVNLMTAGRGIVHSERAGDDLNDHSRLHGIQSWIALPDGSEEIVPAFVHTPAADLPRLQRDGADITVIVGAAFGVSSPVTAYSPTLYLDTRLATGTALELPDDVAELAAYIVEGQVSVDGATYGGGEMVIRAPGHAMQLDATQESRVMVIGGAPVGERQIWWNFVASDSAMIDAAKAAWRAQERFEPVPGETEFIPLPE